MGGRTWQITYHNKKKKRTTYSLPYSKSPGQVYPWRSAGPKPLAFLAMRSTPGRFTVRDGDRLVLELKHDYIIITTRLRKGCVDMN